MTVNIDLSDVTNKYYTVLYRTVVVYEKKNRSLVFSGSRKIPTLGSTVQWETWQASFPTGTVGIRVGIFLSPLNTNDGFYLSYMDTHDGFLFLAQQIRISEILVGDRNSYLIHVILHVCAVYWLNWKSHAWLLSDVIVMLMSHHHVMLHRRDSGASGSLFRYENAV